MPTVSCRSQGNDRPCSTPQHCTAVVRRAVVHFWRRILLLEKAPLQSRRLARVGIVRKHIALPFGAGDPAANVTQ